MTGFAEGASKLVARAVSERAMALLAVAARGMGRADVNEWVERHHVAQYFSSQERLFFLDPAPTRQDLVNFSWRAEALVPLLWALSYVTEMPPVNKQASLRPFVEASQIWSDPPWFMLNAKLRSEGEILDAREEVYELNWLARDARLFGKPTPEAVDPEVVQERHHALNWLVGDRGDNWDTVQTDT